MKIALVHDYLNEFGGAERVLLALSELYPDAPIYTAFYREGSSAYKRFAGKKIITSWAQKVPFFASKLHSPLRFLAPFIWNSFDFSKFDIVIGSSSWYVTKGFNPTSSRKAGLRGARKSPIEICYCHTPPRYLYGYATASSLQKYWIVKVYALLVNHFMRVYDFEAAQRVDWFIANSKEVQSRIKKFYRRDSTVIYPPAVALSDSEWRAGPPVDVEKFSGPVSHFPPASARSNQKSVVDQNESVELRAVGGPSSTATRKSGDGYFLVVSRLVAAKNVDIAVEVCRNLKLPLKIVGTGRELGRLKGLAGEALASSDYSSSEQSELRSSLEEKSSRPARNASHSDAGGQARTIKGWIEFLGDVSDSELVKLYQGCRALIFCGSQEDFGIVPVEAMAAGKPVIALAEGGIKETIIDGKTGLWVEDLAPGAFVLAINKFLEMEKKWQWDAQYIRKHAEKFSKERFKREIKKFVDSKVK